MSSLCREVIIAPAMFLMIGAGVEWSTTRPIVARLVGHQPASAAMTTS